MLKRFAVVVGCGIVVAALGFTGLVWWTLQPRLEPRPLPEETISLAAQEGRDLLADADSVTDYAALVKHFEAQTLKSYCGVASSVTVLSALGNDISQQEFFTENASRVRSRLGVMLSGMTLEDLAGLLSAHGAEVLVHHADSFTVSDFREVVSRNLERAGDFLLVNYQREVLGQSRVGHISPLAAYDNETDLVLILDTASHYYPHTWVPLASLYNAMATTDGASGKTRGYVEVTGRIH